MKIFDFLNFRLNEELDFRPIKCDYDNRQVNNNGLIINIFTFLTKSNTSYSVYINDTLESNHLLSNGVYLQSVNKNKPIPTIYFSETSRGLDPIYFNTLTNKGEFMEVMGKVIYIIIDFISKNKQYNVFSIGEVEPSKFNFYKNWLKNLPITTMEIGLSDNYLDNHNKKTNAYYLVR
jgi:hypothetical protein